MGRKKINTQQSFNLKLEGVPSPRQTEFMLAKTKYVAYGGARGGGKSWALRRKLILLALEYDGIRLLLIRRTIQDLRENHTLELQRELNGVADYNRDENAFYFPNGSRLKLGYCEHENDVLQYQGQDYDVICLDEATQFTEFQFTCLRACLRGGNPAHPKRLYLTCNPGGVGHAWVKRLFIDRDYRNKERKRDYTFIKARVYDNLALMKNNPDYLETLENIPDENLRNAWLNGDWNTFSGQYFTEWDPNVHVCKSFPIPEDWNKYYVNDYGLDALAGLWIAVSPYNKAYVYREVFKGKDAEDGQYRSGVVPSEASKIIKTLEIGEHNNFTRIAPPDLWSKSSAAGESPIELFARHGVYFIKADNDRVHGWLCLKEWFKISNDEKGQATSSLQIFDNCKNLIRCIPLLRYDDRDTNDVAKTPHNITHLPDALRYWAISRPYGNSIPTSKPHFDFPEMQREYDRQHNSLQGYVGGEVTHSYLCGGYDD